MKDRQVRTLDKAADYVLEHGLEGLSLRPLAAALGTSPRMLLYDFESKERLVDEVLAVVHDLGFPCWVRVVMEPVGVFE